MSLLNILRNAKNTEKTKGVVNIIDFIEAKWGLSPEGIQPFELFPAQKVIIKAHYGLPLDDTVTFKIPKTFKKKAFYNFTEKEYLEYLYSEGRCNIKEVIEGDEKRQMILSLGRRSGKSTLSAIIIAYEIYKLIEKGNPHEYYGIPASNVIQMMVVATGKDQAALVYNEASGHFKNCSFFSPYSAKNTLTYAMFQTPKDIEDFGSYRDNPEAQMGLGVTFRPCVAKSLRGYGNILVILDEAAHFATQGQASTKEVVDAVMPSTLAYSRKDPKTRERIGPVESRFIMISSPLGTDGDFYSKFRLGFKNPKNRLSVQAPTWEINPTVDPEFLIDQFSLDPSVFSVEYGASFQGGGRGWIEDESDLIQCIDNTLRPQLTGIPKRPYFMGVDVGLVNDATAIAIGHIEEGNKIVVDLVDSIKAGEGRYEGQERLTHDDVADWVKAYSQKFYIAKGSFDQHEGFAFEDNLKKRGLNQFDKLNLTRSLISEIFKNFKILMFDSKIQVYNHPVPEDDTLCPYLRELTRLVATRHSKYIVTVEAPNDRDSHDDTSDALVRMVYTASQHFGNYKYISQGSNNRDPALSSRTNYEHIKRTLRGGGSHPTRTPPGRKKGRRW